VVALLALPIGSGCAFWLKQPVPPAFQHFELRSEVATKDGHELKGDTHADTTFKGALIGGGSLAVTGAGIGMGAGLLCGPIAVIVCVPAFMIIGGVAGGVSGLVVGGVGGLPWKTTDEVNAVLLRLQNERDFAKELGAAVATAIPREHQAEPGQAQATLTARLDEVDLRQHMSERISIRMWSSMTQEWNEGGETKKNTCKYTYTTPVADVEDWLLEDGKMFGDAFTQGIDTFARWMARDQEAFEMRTPLPATSDTPATCFQL
jgi:hypothetical protein